MRTGRGAADAWIWAWQRARVRAFFCCIIEFCLTVFERLASRMHDCRCAIAPSAPWIAPERAIDVSAAALS